MSLRIDRPLAEQLALQTLAIDASQYAMAGYTDVHWLTACCNRRELALQGTSRCFYDALAARHWAALPMIATFIFGTCRKQED